MFAVLNCIEHHDLKLVALAALICFVSVAAGLTAYRRALSKSGASRGLWLTIVALMLAAGVWSTHFMAMLAYQEDLQISFRLGLSALSGLIALVGLGSGFAIAASHGGWRTRSLGGGVAGCAIVAMHFTGVAAMRLPAQIAWNPPLLALAILIGVTAAAAALATAGRMSSPARALGAAVLLIVAICGLHFVAMSAVILTPDAALHGPGLFSRHQLAVGVASLAGLILAAGIAIMTVDRFSVLSALSSLSAALNEAPSAIAFFDRGRRLLFWNERYAEILTSYGLKAVRSLPLETIFERARPDPVERKRLREEATPLQIPDGRWMQPVVSATADGGLALVMNDVSDQLALIRQQSEARELAETASRAKSDFLANISHEIRTPLNAMLGMVQVIVRDPLAPQQRERMDVVASASRDLLAVINSILDISRMETDGFELESRVFGLSEVLAAAVEAIAAESRAKGVAFRLDIAPAAEGTWVGDAPRLVQIIANLASNAVKFTERGQVRVDVRLDGAGGLAFEVVDTGLGVPADKLETIFETFTQVDGSSKRRFGGTGLGLSICRRLVSLMGGELTVASQMGRGSVFRFALPLERRALPGPAPVPEAAPAAEDRPLRVLAAEDNAANRMVLRALLAPFGLDLTIVEDGAEAVESYRAGEYDLILMDIQMPEKNGIEATREIRALESREGLARVPIIAVTANVMRHQIGEYLAAGMDGCVAKPIDTAVLVQAIETALACDPSPHQGAPTDAENSPHKVAA